MMDIKRIRPIGVSSIFILCAFIMAACGGSSNSTNSEPTTDNSTSDASTNNTSDPADSSNSTESTTDSESTDSTANNDVSDTTSTSSLGSTDSTTSTVGIGCDYNYSEYNSDESVEADSMANWTCSDTERTLAANGIPDHAVGTFPNSNNPNTIASQTVNISYTVAPTLTTTATELGGPRGAQGYVLNGVKIDASTAGSCPDSATDTAECSLSGNSGGWNIEALGDNNPFDFGVDENNAHVQPGGAYHYHGMPEGFIQSRGGDATKMTMIGWAADGYPIYARYGYTDANDATSPIKIMTGSYQHITEVDSSRPSTSIIPMGSFQQDWQYVAGLGDLDECNGRTGVTPEFPNGTYHYYATDSYPYFQRCVRGAVTSTGGQDGPPRGPAPNGPPPRG